MKRLVLLLICLAASFTLHAEGVKGAHIKFEETEYDFGNISRKEGNKSCSFRFVNDGTEPLVLLAVTTTCSCLKAEFSRKPIAPGESGVVKMVLESAKADKGLFRRIVQVRSTSNGGANILTIKGVVKD